MSVVIPDMQLPEKCCKCVIMRRPHNICPLTGRKVIDPGKRHEACPLKEVSEDVAEA